MIALLQRVSNASVAVDNVCISSINQGLLAFIGIEKTDTQHNITKMANKLVNYRVFCDDNNQMNLSLSDIAGQLLLVPQFTLAANTSKGLRPSFSSSAPPAQAKTDFDQLVTTVQNIYDTVQTGQFGADMQVSLTNDGPVTFWLQV